MTLAIIVAVAVVIVGLVAWKLQPVRLSQQQVNELASTDEGTNLLGEMILLRGELQTRRRRELFWRIVGFGCIAAVLWVVLTVKDTQDEQIRQKRDARLTVCQRDNTDAAKQHQLWEGLLLLPGRPPDPAKIDAFLTFVADTPANRAAVNVILSTSPQDPAQVAALRQLLDDTFPQRSCDQAAIDAYYTTTTAPHEG